MFRWGLLGDVNVKDFFFKELNLVLLCYIVLLWG